MGGSDSSDEESESEDEVVEAGPRVDMGSLPMVAKDDKSVSARLEQAQKKKVRGGGGARGENPLSVTTRSDVGYRMGGEALCISVGYLMDSMKRR